MCVDCFIIIENKSFYTIIKYQRQGPNCGMRSGLEDIMATSKEQWPLTYINILSLPTTACKNLKYQGLVSYKVQLNCFRIMLKALCSEAVD